MVTPDQPATRIDEIASRVYRISTSVPPSIAPGGFSFNQYLVMDDEPLLFHTGPRRMFPLTMSAIERVTPADSLRWIAFSHFESDECGALNQLLAAAPRAVPVCSRVNAMINADAFDRPPRALADGEQLPMGGRTLEWLDTPHLPHAWECGYLYDADARLLLCGDLFTQPGSENPPLTSSDILGPSEALRAQLDYWAHAERTGEMLERLARLSPRVLACMHGSAFEGDGAALLRALAAKLAVPEAPPEQAGGSRRSSPRASVRRPSA